MDLGAHWGHDLSHRHLFVLKHCGPCHSDTGSDSCRVASYLTKLQTTKSHQLKVPKITLSTYRWTNKEHFPVWLWLHSLTGTEVPKLEGMWLPGWTKWGTSLNNWIKLRTKTWVRSPWSHACFLFIPTLNICKKDINDIIKWYHCCLLLHFGQEKPLHMHSRVMPTCLCICQHPWPVSLTPPCTNHSISFVSYFQCLWHSPSGNLLCPHTRVWNLLKAIAQNDVILFIKIYGITKNHKAGKIEWNEHIQQLDT